MTNAKKYRLNKENLDTLDLFSQKKYADALGLSTVFLNKIFNNNAVVKLGTAKGIISLAYDISVRDNERMQELLEKHFTVVE